MSLDQPYPSLDEFLHLMGEAGVRISEINASEGAAGNLSIFFNWAVDPRRKFPIAEAIRLPCDVPHLAGGSILMSGSGRRLREIIDNPLDNLGFVQINEDGETARLYTTSSKLFARLSSEFNSHLAIHNDQVATTGTNFHAVVHAQPRYLTYLSHIADYRDVDPMFGTLADVDRLLAEAHARGLKVVIDQVLSHTSIDHAWFRESGESRDNPKADWYVWADPKEDGTPPNNWMSLFGGVAWRWEPRREQYYLHNFLASQPDLNFHNPAVQDATLDNVKFWLDRGVDGLRLDAINFCFHDAQLRDNPPPHTHAVSRFFNTAEQPDAVPVLGSHPDSADEPTASAGPDAAQVSSLEELLQAQTARLASMESELETARRALHERKLIERAKGALMARMGLTEDAAFRALQKTSMDHNRKLVDVAEAALALPDLVFGPRPDTHQN